MKLESSGRSVGGCSDGADEEQQIATDFCTCDSSSCWSDSDSDLDSVSVSNDAAEETVGAAPMMLDNWGMSAIRGAGFRLGKFAHQDMTEGTFVRHAARESDLASFAVKSCSAAKGVDFASASSKIASEYELLQGLVHTSIVSVAYLFHSKHDVWLFREWCVDGCLWSYVQKHGEFEEPHAFRLIDQMVEGIYYLHKKGIVHQNIQPSNVLLARHAEALKIAGFSKAERSGFDLKPAARQREVPVALHREQLHELAHESKAWMAPEQICGCQKSPLVDVFSGGLCAGFMLLGRHPFSSKTLTSDEAANAHVLRDAVKSMCRGKRPAVQQQGMSTSAVAFLEACLRRKPAARVSSQDLRLHPVLLHNAVDDKHPSQVKSLQASVEAFRAKTCGCLPSMQAGRDLSVIRTPLQSMTVLALPSLHCRPSKKALQPDTLHVLPEYLGHL